MKNKLSDLVEIEKLRLFLGNLARATGVSLCVVDDNGNFIIQPTNEAPFCVAVRKDRRIKERCVYSVLHGAVDAMHYKRTVFFRCPFGLLEFVVPIIINGEYLGAVCGGEVAAKELDACVDISAPREEPIKTAAIATLYENIPTIDGKRYIEITKFISEAVNNFTEYGIMSKIMQKKENVNADERIKPALAYIEDNYSQEITLEQLAAACFISKDYMSKLFYRITKKNVTEYISDYRINKAKELLRDTNIKISGVAEKVGFSDAAYFYRVFKKSVGVTPAQYRATHRSVTI